MNERKYYIEFVGQHTAGKTSTIHDIVDNELLEPKVAIYPQNIQRSRLHFFLSLPILVLQNLRHLWFMVHFLSRYGEWSWINYHAAGRHLMKMVILHPYYKRFDFDIWMKDDMLHLLPRIAFRRTVDVEGVFREFFTHFSYLYDGIVYLNLSYDIMQQRFRSRFTVRPDKRRRSREPVYERAFIQNEILKRMLTEQTQVPVLVLDGADEVHKNSLQTVEFVKEIVYEN